jgi:DNA-binding NarL/FixJ family response regulator
MKCEPTLTSSYRPSAFQLDPTLTSKEAIILRALAAGRTDKRVCNEFHMERATFLCMTRGMREKIRTADNYSLIEWAKRHIKRLDQRIDRPERYARAA